MKVVEIFAKIKSRALILWITDMSLGILSYFYLTSPALLHKYMLELQKQQSDMGMDADEMELMMGQMLKSTALTTIIVILILHSLVFYKYFREKRTAQAYVKVYCFLAALSLAFWLLTDFKILNFWIVIPTAIYGSIFWIEYKRLNKYRPADQSKVT